MQDIPTGSSSAPPPTEDHVHLWTQLEAQDVVIAELRHQQQEQTWKLSDKNDQLVGFMTLFDFMVEGNPAITAVLEARRSQQYRFRRRARILCRSIRRLRKRPRRIYWKSASLIRFANLTQYCDVNLTQFWWRHCNKIYCVSSANGDTKFLVSLVRMTSQYCVIARWEFRNIINKWRHKNKISSFCFSMWLIPCNIRIKWRQKTETET